MAGGYDIFAAEDRLIPIGGRAAVKTGVVTQMEAGVVGIIKDRSGLALNNGITVLAGTMDADFTQEWLVILLNTGTYPFVISRGDRIAQCVFVRHLEVTPVLTAEIEYGEQKRVGGFGSTGA